MSKNNGFDEVSAMKLLSFALVFLLLATSIIALLIFPSIKQYKAAKLALGYKIVNLNKIEQIHGALLNDLNSLKNENKKPLRAIASNFNEGTFVDRTGKFFSSVKLVKMPKMRDDEPFLRYELNVTGSIKNPDNFYEFLGFINDCGNIIGVDFPVSMRSFKDRIDTNFELRVYKAN